MINADWHRAHRMPKNPTLEQRLEWHREHARHCDCRKPPPKLAALLAAGRVVRHSRPAAGTPKRS